MSPMYTGTRRVLLRSAASAVIVQDRFTDTNNTGLTSHTPNIDKIGLGWQAGSGTWFITANNKTDMSGDVGVNNIYIDSGQANCTITCDITTSAGTPRYSGLIIRASASNDNIEVLLRTSENDVQVGTNINGTRAGVATGALTVNVSTTYTVEVVLSGTSIIVSVDGVQIVNTTSSHNLTDTSHGLFQWDSITDTLWDTFKVVK